MKHFGNTSSQPVKRAHHVNYKLLPYQVIDPLTLLVLMNIYIYIYIYILEVGIDYFF